MTVIAGLDTRNGDIVVRQDGTVEQHPVIVHPSQVEVPTTVEQKVEHANALARAAAAELPWGQSQPIAAVQWIHSSKVQANDYNPNAVAQHEMRLLHTSIEQDGYTQPIVAIWDPDARGGSDPDRPPGRYVIVDGFHRYTVLLKYGDIFERTAGYLPLVVLDKSIADRIASTVRHNRARGKHSVAGMGNLIFQLLREGVSDAEICNRIGLEPEELARLKHVTGYSKLYAEQEYGRPLVTVAQVEAKAAYKKEHPDEHVPANF